MNRSYASEPIHQPGSLSSHEHDHPGGDGTVIEYGFQMPDGGWGVFRGDGRQQALTRLLAGGRVYARKIKVNIEWTEVGLKPETEDDPGEERTARLCPPEMSLLSRRDRPRRRG